jgi:hypothetical protein
VRRLTLAILVAGIALAGCGGDDDGTTGSATSDSIATRTATNAVLTGKSSTTAPDAAITTKTATSKTGGVGPGPSGGETADLPLCSQGPPPCRDAQGMVIEP